MKKRIPAAIGMCLLIAAVLGGDALAQSWLILPPGDGSGSKQKWESEKLGTVCTGDCSAPAEFCC